MNEYEMDQLAAIVEELMNNNLRAILQTQNQNEYNPHMFEDVIVNLNRQQLGQIPIQRYNSIRHIHDECTICVLPLSKNVYIRKLPCCHVFHKNCIDKWLLEYSVKCPLCKQDVRDLIEN